MWMEEEESRYCLLNMLKNLALSVAKLYDLTEKQALEELKEIKNVVENNWRKLAQQYGLSRSEIEGMSPAFDMAFKS